MRTYELLASLAIIAPLLTVHAAEPDWSQGGEHELNQSIDSNKTIELKKSLTLNIAAPHTVSLRGAISGPDYGLYALEKKGSGRLELWGDNGYTDANDGITRNSILQEGTLHVGHSNALGNPLLTILEVHGGTTLSYAPGINVGTKLYLQDNTAGATPDNIGSGSITWRVDDGLATHSGSILHDATPLVKTGSGTLALNASATNPDGTLTIAQGAVRLNGLFAGKIDVRHGTVLYGADQPQGTMGRAGRVHVLSGGTLAPAEKLIINGTPVHPGDNTLRFDANGHLHVRARADGNVDAVNVTWGLAQLDGHVLVLPQGSRETWQAGYDAPIITTEHGTIHGRFASVRSAAPWLEPELIYDTDHVLLRLRLRAGPLPHQNAQGVGWAASVRNILVDDSRFLREAVYRHAPQPQRFWMHKLHSSGDFGQPKHQTQRRIGGLLLGINHDINPAVRAGIYGGWTRSHVHDDGSKQPGFDASATLDSMHLGLHAQFRHPQGWQAVLGAAHSRHRIHSRRTGDLSVSTGHLHSRYRARSSQIFGELRYPLWESVHTDARIEPLLQLARVWTSRSAHDEGRSTLAMAHPAERINTLFGGVGLHAHRRLELPRGGVTLSGTVAWRYAHGDTRRPVTQYYAGDPLRRSMAAHGLPIARHAWQLQLGMQADAGRHTQIGVHYAGQHARRQQDHGVQLTLTRQW